MYPYSVQCLVLVLARASHFAPLPLKEGIWVSCCSLHASWEFLFPVLCWDPCPLKLQFLLDVLLLTLLEKRRVLVVYCQTFLQCCILLSTLKHHEETGFFTAVVEGFNFLSTVLLGSLPHQLGD